MAVAALAVRFMNARLCIGHLSAGTRCDAQYHGLLCRGITDCDTSGLTRWPGPPFREGDAFTRLCSRFLRQVISASEAEFRDMANRSAEARDQALLALTRISSLWRRSHSEWRDFASHWSGS